MRNSNGIDYFQPQTVTGVNDSTKTVNDEPLVSAELEASIRDGGKQALAELLWYAIQLNDLKAVATFTKFINGMRDENEY